MNAYDKAKAMAVVFTLVCIGIWALCAAAASMARVGLL